MCEKQTELMESGVRDRLLECMEKCGLSKFDARIIDLGIPKHKLQSMWRNTTGDVPGIILERVCKEFPELDITYICTGIKTTEGESANKTNEILKVCMELISNFKQRDNLINKLISMSEL